jgi:hypothetical protein
MPPSLAVFYTRDDERAPRFERANRLGVAAVGGQQDDASAGSNKPYFGINQRNG